MHIHTYIHIHICTQLAASVFADMNVGVKTHLCNVHTCQCTGAQDTCSKVHATLTAKECTYVYTYTHTHTHTYAHENTCVPVSEQRKEEEAFQLLESRQVYICIYSIDIYIHVDIYIYTFLNIYAYIQVYICTYILERTSGYSAIYIISCILLLRSQDLFLWSCRVHFGPTKLGFQRGTKTNRVPM